MASYQPNMNDFASIQLILINTYCLKLEQLREWLTRLGFKNFLRAAAIPVGVELYNMIRKGQRLLDEILSPRKQPYALAA